ncbi:MAG: hypothetical protein FWD30_02810 [Dehalococcoidia bacterium]|nr:hypothetical protein [Dehalococcoidia bacterium]
MNEEEKLSQAIGNTTVLRRPKQALSTFGATTINYYVLSSPAYAESESSETVVRTGRVIANKPHIVTPYYLSRLDGFSAEAQRYMRKLMEMYGPDVPGIYYTYSNEHGGTDVMPGSIEDVLAKINAEIDERKDFLAAVIRGEDTLWDVALMKFIFEITKASSNWNITELRSHGLFGVVDGVPAGARANIDDMFLRLKDGAIEPLELQIELERWGLFEEYQDRFFATFRP